MKNLINTNDQKMIRSVRKMGLATDFKPAVNCQPIYRRRAHRAGVIIAKYKFEESEFDEVVPKKDMIRISEQIII